MENVLPLAHRNAALAKYLLTISKHANTHADSSRKVTNSRKRLHALYLLSDVFHHLKYHNTNSGFDDAVRPLQNALPDLIGLIIQDLTSRVRRRLQELLHFWAEDEVLEATQLAVLQDLLAGKTDVHPQAPVTGVAIQKSSTKELAFIMPASHGDPTTPYHDLPAGNFMPHILPNSSAPMRADQIRPLQFAPGPASAELVIALKEFLKEVSSLDNVGAFHEDEGITTELDELGQVTYRDEDGEKRGDTYYGWSRSFCEKMKHRGKNGSQTSELNKTRERSSSGYSSLRKRRRLSSSQHSESYSPPQGRFRSRSPNRFERPERTRSPSWSAAAEISSGRPQFQNNPPPMSFNQYQSPQPLPVPTGYQYPAQPHVHPPQNTQYQSLPATQYSGFGGIPPPPPRPLNWGNAPWPPPPPPQFAGGYGFPGGQHNANR